MVGFDGRRRRGVVLGILFCLVLVGSALARGTMGADNDFIGVVIAAMGRVQVLPKGEGNRWNSIEKGYKVRLLDVIRTGNTGRARVQMADRDEQRNAGPSVINIAAASEMAFSEFKVNFDKPRRSKGLFDLIKGTVRTFFKGWRGDSQVSVRTGVTVCGVRGSEQIVRHDPTHGGNGRTWQTNVTGNVFTKSADDSMFPTGPSGKPLQSNYQRFARSRDPATWLDILLSEERRQQLLDQTGLPGDGGKTLDDLYKQLFPGSWLGGTGGDDGGDGGDDDDGTGTGTLKPGDEYMGVEWTADGLPDCRAEPFDLMLNNYAWKDLDDYQDFTFYRDELINNRFVVSGSIDSTCPGAIVDIEVSVDGGRSWVSAIVNPETMTFRYAFDPTGFRELDLKVRATYAPEVVAAYREAAGLEN